MSEWPAYEDLKSCNAGNCSSGCGVACIAMLARTTYEGVRNTIFPKKKNKLYIETWDHMRASLRRMGVERYAQRVLRARSWESIQELSIVWCMSNAERKRGGKVGHYVVYDPQPKLIYDPLKKRAVQTKLIYDPLKERAVPCWQIRRYPISYLECRPVNAPSQRLFAF